MTKKNVPESQDSTQDLHTLQQMLRVVGYTVFISELEQMSPKMRGIVAQLSRDNKKLKKDVHIDETTGLKSKRAFISELKGMCARRNLPEDDRDAFTYPPSVIILLDINDFKLVNDKIGYPAGDAGLKHIAEILRDMLPSPEYVTARVGGDELAIIMRGKGMNPDIARKRIAPVLDKIRKTSYSYTEVDKDSKRVLGLHDIYLSVACGITDIRTGDAVIDVIERAQDDMKEDKRRIKSELGPNTVRTRRLGGPPPRSGGRSHLL